MKVKGTRLNQIENFFKSLSAETISEKTLNSFTGPKNNQRGQTWKRIFLTDFRILVHELKILKLTQFQYLQFANQYAKICTYFGTLSSAQIKFGTQIKYLFWAHDLFGIGHVPKIGT